MKELDDLIKAIEVDDLEKVKKLLPTQGMLSWIKGEKKSVQSFLNKRDKKGNTPLIYAIEQSRLGLYNDHKKKIIASENNQQIVKWLLDSGADINLVDARGCSPFAAILERDIDFALNEIYTREDFKISDADKLSLLASNRRYEYIPLLSTEEKVVDFVNSIIEPNAVDFKGNNLLHIRATHKLLSLEFLLKKNVNINHTNKEGKTAFGDAISRNYISLAKQIKQIPGFILSKEDQKILNEKLHRVDFK